MVLSHYYRFGSEEENWADCAPRVLVHRTMHSIRESADQEVVILSHVLADEVNEGYSHLGNLELSSVNGSATTPCCLLDRCEDNKHETIGQAAQESFERR